MQQQFQRVQAGFLGSIIGEIRDLYSHVSTHIVGFVAILFDKVYWFKFLRKWRFAYSSVGHDLCFLGSLGSLQQFMLFDRQVYVKLVCQLSWKLEHQNILLFDRQVYVRLVSPVSWKLEHQNILRKLFDFLLQDIVLVFTK